MHRRVVKKITALLKLTRVIAPWMFRAAFIALLVGAGSCTQRTVPLPMPLVSEPIQVSSGPQVALGDPIDARTATAVGSLSATNLLGGNSTDQYIVGNDLKIYANQLLEARLASRGFRIFHYSKEAGAKTPERVIVLSVISASYEDTFWPNETRSWISADVKVRGKTIRVITTHLESFDLTVQEQQGMELVSGPADTPLPVMLSGDFNSSADGGPDATPTYPNLIAAGFEDLWSIAHPLEPGDTCCQDADLMNAVSALFERIDLVLARGGFGVASIELVGNVPADKTPSGLWPSDHAGIVAMPRIP
jgi:endonuclease/exonuclease/phosphatase family metal-dependent hydrolase